MSHFESCIYRCWHHDSEFSLQTVSWHGFPRTDDVSQQQQSTSQQQSEWRSRHLSSAKIPPSPPMELLSEDQHIYHQSWRTQSRNSQAGMQKPQFWPARLAMIESNRFFDCFYDHCNYTRQMNEIDEEGKEYFGSMIICRIHLIPIVVLYFNL